MMRIEVIILEAVIEVVLLVIFIAALIFLTGMCKHLFINIYRALYKQRGRKRG